VVWKEIAVKKYSSIKRGGTRPTRRVDPQRQAFRPAADEGRILLKADVSELGEGWSDSRIAVALDTRIATIERTRRQLVEEGFEAVLKAQIQSQFRPAADFRRRSRSKIDRAHPLSGPGGFRPLEPAPALRERSRDAGWEVTQTEEMRRFREKFDAAWYEEMSKQTE
jgi:hypothetical protein